MSNPISEAEDQVIQEFLQLPSSARAQVCLAIYALAPLLASELHSLSMMVDLERSAEGVAKAPKGPKQNDPLVRHHVGTSQL